MDAVDTYAEVINNNDGNPDIAMSFGADDDGGDMDSNEAGFVAKSSRVAGGTSPSEFIIDIREYDVPYYLRVAIDKGEFDRFTPSLPFLPIISTDDGRLLANLLYTPFPTRVFGRQKMPCLHTILLIRHRGCLQKSESVYGILSLLKMARST